MGFYIRKAFKIGPFRLNLSKSGLGMSVGVKGFRVGSGPRGNYVHMGVGGLYYRQSIPSRSSEDVEAKPSRGNKSYHDLFGEYNSIESSDVSKFTDISAEHIVDEINSNRRKLSFWPISALLGVALFVLFTFMQFESIYNFVLVGVFVVISVVMFWIDGTRKSTSLIYNLDSDTHRSYQAIIDAFNQLSCCSKIWHVQGETCVKDIKRVGGAQEAIKRREIVLFRSKPPSIQTNLSVPCIDVGKIKMWLFPDRVFLFSSHAVGSARYSDIEMSIEQIRFIENATVPRDANVVGKTWRCVNLDGGPDRRYKDNPEIPVTLYEDIRFQSKSGLNERLEVSKVGVCEKFVQAIKQMPTIQSTKHNPSSNEKCTRCGRSIGVVEQAYLHNFNVVCNQCYLMMNGES
jgi:hypothetical protein